jgi:hypothetical protein
MEFPVSGELTNEIPGPAVGLTTLLDYCMEEEDQSLNTFPLRPSAAGRCSRSLAFELWRYLGKPGAFPTEKKSPATKRLLSLGSSIEYHSIRNFQSITKKNPDFKITYKQQIVLLFQLDPANENDKKPPTIKGSVDFALENLKQGYTIFLDSKSAKDKFSQAYSTKWDETIDDLINMESTQTISIDHDDEGRQCVGASFWVPNLPAFVKELQDPFFVDNFTQLNLYCCTDFAKQINVPAGAIYKYNKNDSRHLEVRFAPSQELFDEFKTKCQGIYNLVMNAESLDDLKKRRCEFPIGTMKAAFCPCSIYAGEERGAGLKAWFATFPPKAWPTDTKKLKNKEVEALFGDFLQAEQDAERAEKIEQNLVGILIEENVNKVKLQNGQIFEVKHYKTGGVMNGPRTALKRTKA